MAELRTLRTSKGAQVQTSMTDAEAIAALRQIDNDFARKLVRVAARYGLSYDQTVWAHKLVIEDGKPQRETTEIGDLSALIRMFDTARTHLKNPKIWLSLPTDRGPQDLQLSVAGAGARFPGSINVTDGAKFYESRFFGRIFRDGTFEAGRAGVPDGLIAFLREFARRPAEMAAEYGRLHGHCCFCNLPLCDERSTAVGYGRICAANYSLPWGDVAVPVAELQGALLA